jgi:NTE family protein
LLADAGLLGSVRYSSSVSGGSIANGLLARHYPELEAASFTGEAFDRVVLEPFVARITSDSLI